MSPAFIRAADTLAKQLTELFDTKVLVSNAQNAVVAGRQTCPELRKSDLCGAGDRFLRFPICVHNQTGEVFIEQLVGAEEISPQLARAFINLVISQITHSPALRHAPDQQSRKDRMVQNLLRESRSPNAADLTSLEAANQLGLDLASAWAVILISTQTPPPETIDSIDSFFRLAYASPIPICAAIGNGEFVVLKASNTAGASGWDDLDTLEQTAKAFMDKWHTQTRTHIGVSIGRYHPSLLGLSRSYQEAQIALRLGRQFTSEAQVHCLHHLGVAAFACVADEQTKVELAHHLLSPLDSEPDLLNTLRVFFDQGCALTSTAKALIIHRNTLTYRLEKIVAITGLDPRRFEDAVQMRIALLLRGLKPYSQV